MTITIEVQEDFTENGTLERVQSTLNRLARDFGYARIYKTAKETAMAPERTIENLAGEVLAFVRVSPMEETLL